MFPGPLEAAAFRHVIVLGDNDTKGGGQRLTEEQTLSAIQILKSQRTKMEVDPALSSHELRKLWVSMVESCCVSIYQPK